MYRLIESFDSSSTVAFDGEDYPVVCLVEDDDGQRLLVVGHGKPSEYALREAQRAGAFAVHDANNSVVYSFDGTAEPVVIPVDAGRSFSYRRYREIVDDTAPVPASGFVHLHAHSEYSALDGLSTVEEMVATVAGHGQSALAITDHGICASHPYLQKAADAAGIRPIFGLEANLVDDRLWRPHPKEWFTPENVGTLLTPEEARAAEVAKAKDYYHLILWAMDDEGLRNLWAMSTEANRDGFYTRPRLDWSTLERYNTGVMASTACLKGIIAHPLLTAEDDNLARQNLARLQAIFDNGRLYAELHTNRTAEQRVINQITVHLAREAGLPLIAAVDSHYPCPEDHSTHRAWIATQTNKDLQDEPDLFAGDSDYHLMSEVEVREALSYLPADVVEESIANTGRVADRCTARIDWTVKPPVYSRTAGGVQDDVERLARLCLDPENWAKKVHGKRHSEEVYIERFEREMGIVVPKDFCGYFLQVADYCAWARENGYLVGPGRGSGGGCLIAYLLGITGIDPVDSGLLFERFLTEGRTELPDFDVDFPTVARDPLTAYITERWGEEHVVRVGTHSRLRNKAAIRNLAAAMATTIDIHWPDIDKVSAIIERAEAHTAGKGITWDELMTHHEEELAPYVEKYPEMFRLAGLMEGRIKTYGKHACGVLIDPDVVLTDALPLRRAADDEPLVTEFDMKALEAGFTKFDLLTIRNLDTIQGAIDIVRDRYGVDVPIEHWREEYDDPMVWAEVSAGRTLGLFQVEKPGGTRMCKQIMPENLDHLADVITLIRPGPMRSGITDLYLRRRAGAEPVTYAHPLLETVLDKTYGLMLYQEDVMNVCQVLAGYSLAEADRVRRLLGKKEVEKVEAEGRVFVEGCTRNGIDPSLAADLWEQIKEFAKYSFNRSHAYGYAVIGYWCAWLKFHWPIAFFGSALSTIEKGEIPDFVGEARRMGWRVLPPDINASGFGFSVDIGAMAVRYGIDSVKDVGAAVAAAVVEGQPYTSFDDFLERKGQACNRGHIRKLAAVGTFDSIEPNRAALEARLAYEESGAAERCVLKDDDANQIVTYGDDTWVLPCTYDWADEPREIGKSGRPLKAKRPPKKCTKACRRYEQPGPVAFEHVVPYTQVEIRTREKDWLGLYLSSTPFDDLPDDVLEECRTAEELETATMGEHIVAGVITKVKPHTTSGGKPMAFLGVYARDGNIDVTVFTKEWERHRDHLRKDALVIMLVAKDSRGFKLRELVPLVEGEEVA